jgi:hypothetical protein
LLGYKNQSSSSSYKFCCLLVHLSCDFLIYQNVERKNTAIKFFFLPVSLYNVIEPGEKKDGMCVCLHFLFYSSYPFEFRLKMFRHLILFTSMSAPHRRFIKGVPLNFLLYIVCRKTIQMKKRKFFYLIVNVLFS